MDNEKKYLEEEIRKEFQLERMILFSDAVFAIVITLMAIEIRLPDNGPISSETFPKELKHLFPILMAYIVTFFFIGQTWYEHLRLFSLLKDYDKGLVVRNLFMLFFIGLFPFSVTVVAHPNNAALLPFAIYFSIILACKGAQLILQHYILVKRPQLRLTANIHDAMLRFEKTRIAIIMLAVVFILIIITYFFISSPEQKVFAFLWIAPFPFLIKYFRKRIEKKKPVPN